MSRTLCLAAAQFAPGDPDRDPLETAESLLREAAAGGARLVLLPELLAGPYFCKTQDAAHFASAHPWREHPVLTRLAPVAAELGLVLPLSIFERDGPHYYNSLVMVDADGEALGVYRKSHIPDGPGYQEKFYFRPGRTGFRVWDTRAGRIGVGICWDQWFPEAARTMALMGAEVLLYPTAIGAEPHMPGLDTAARWRRAMLGHAVSNTMPVVAVNRTGIEDGQAFYGTSFIAGPDGEILGELGRSETGIVVASLDLDAIALERADWGFFRDRRPDLYAPLVDA